MRVSQRVGLLTQTVRFFNLFVLVHCVHLRLVFPETNAEFDPRLHTRADGISRAPAVGAHVSFGWPGLKYDDGDEEVVLKAEVWIACFKM